MPSLKWVRAQGRPHVFSVYKKITTIGRSGANDISIEDSDLAEHHAQLVFDGRDFQLSEVDKAPIQVNGKKKRRTKIFHNDAIQLGTTELVFSVYDELNSEKEEQDHHAELSGMLRLSEFNQRLLSIRSIPEQINALLDAVVEVTHAAKGFVLLLQDGDVQVTAARNLEKKDISGGIRHLSDSIIQQCIETQKPLIVSDALNDTMFRSSESVMNLKLCSVMVAPLMAQGELLGLIYVGNDNVVNLFEQSSLDILTIFAGQASLILQRRNLTQPNNHR